MSVAVRLLARVLFALVLVNVVTDAIFWGFAPPWLLLDANTVARASATARGGAAALLFAEIAIAVLLVIAQPPGRVKSNAPDADAVLRLFALPSRIVTVHVLLSVVIAVAPLSGIFRPNELDARTVAALVLLYLTLVSIASLPLYVATRSAVATVLERISVQIARDALGELKNEPRGTQRVERRLLAAVAAPVALIGIGASLLVYAHVRNADELARQSDARAVALGVLDRVDGRADGRDEAIARARAAGFAVEIETQREAPTPDAFDPNVVRVPLDDGRAVVRTDPLELAPATAGWLALAILGVAFAAWLGAQLGSALGSDVRLATEEITSMGAAEVLRGSAVIGSSRYSSVRELTEAIDRLGRVFREFARAQERAILARATTERMRGVLLATMSHDLKGPLNAILGFSALAGRASLGAQQRESLGIIEHRGKELLRLVETVLDAARIEAGELPLEKQPAPLGDIVMASVLDARELAAELGRPIEASDLDTLPSVSVDSARLAQALTGLIIAAAHVAAEASTVRITAELGEEKVVVRIESRGTKKIDPERTDMLRAFESADHARRQGSIGLRVLVARSIIEAHAGTVDVKIEDDDQVRFEVELAR